MDKYFQKYIDYKRKYMTLKQSLLLKGGTDINCEFGLGDQINCNVNNINTNCREIKGRVSEDSYIKYECDGDDNDCKEYVGEKLPRYYCPTDGKVSLRALIIGGGPVGLMTGIMLLDKGHDVTIVEISPTYTREQIFMILNSFKYHNMNYLEEYLPKSTFNKLVESGCLVAPPPRDKRGNCYKWNRAEFIDTYDDGSRRDPKKTSMYPGRGFSIKIKRFEDVLLSEYKRLGGALYKPSIAEGRATVNVNFDWSVEYGFIGSDKGFNLVKRFDKEYYDIIIGCDGKNSLIRNNILRTTGDLKIICKINPLDQTEEVSLDYDSRLRAKYPINDYPIGYGLISTLDVKDTGLIDDRLKDEPLIFRDLVDDAFNRNLRQDDHLLDNLDAPIWNSRPPFIGYDQYGGPQLDLNPRPQHRYRIFVSPEYQNDNKSLYLGVNLGKSEFYNNIANFYKFIKRISGQILQPGELSQLDSDISNAIRSENLEIIRNNFPQIYNRIKNIQRDVLFYGRDKLERDFSELRKEPELFDFSLSILSNLAYYGFIKNQQDIEKFGELKIFLTPIVLYRSSIFMGKKSGEQKYCAILGDAGIGVHFFSGTGLNNGLKCAYELVEMIDNEVSVVNDINKIVNNFNTFSTDAATSSVGASFVPIRRIDNDRVIDMSNMGSLVDLQIYDGPDGRITRDHINKEVGIIVNNKLE